MYGKSILNPLIGDIELFSNLNTSKDIDFHNYSITSFTTLAGEGHFEFVGIFFQI